MKRITTIIQIKPEVKAAIVALAKADSRSMANYIERVLEAHIDSEQKP